MLVSTPHFLSHAGIWRRRISLEFEASLDELGECTEINKRGNARIGQLSLCEESFQARMTLQETNKGQIGLERLKRVIELRGSRLDHLIIQGYISPVFLASRGNLDA